MVSEVVGSVVDSVVGSVVVSVIDSVGCMSPVVISGGLSVVSDADSEVLLQEQHPKATARIMIETLLFELW